MFEHDLILVQVDELLFWLHHLEHVIWIIHEHFHLHVQLISILNKKIIKRRKIFFSLLSNEE
jgi:hypothetical protein